MVLIEVWTYRLYSDVVVNCRLDACAMKRGLITKTSMAMGSMVLWGIVFMRMRIQRAVSCIAWGIQ